MVILGGYELATVKFPSTSLGGAGGAPIDFLVQITSSSYLPPPPPPELGIHIVLVDFPSNRQKVDENEKEGNSHNIVIPPPPATTHRTSLPWPICCQGLAVSVYNNNLNVIEGCSVILFRPPPATLTPSLPSFTSRGLVSFPSPFRILWVDAPLLGCVPLCSDF